MIDLINYFLFLCAFVLSIILFIEVHKSKSRISIKDTSKKNVSSENDVVECEIVSNQEVFEDIVDRDKYDFDFYNSFFRSNYSLLGCGYVPVAFNREGINYIDNLIESSIDKVSWQIPFRKKLYDSFFFETRRFFITIDSKDNDKLLKYPLRGAFVILGGNNCFLSHKSRHSNKNIYSSEAAVNFLYQKAIDLLNKHDYDKAIYTISTTIDAYGDNSKLYVFRAGCYIKKGLFEKAKTDFEKAITVEKNSYSETQCRL